MQGLGSGPITLFGDDELKARYLPAVAAGDKIAAFALSEPDAGSDVAAMTTSARDDRISGTKTWISNGGVPDLSTGLPAAPGGSTALAVDAHHVQIALGVDELAPHPPAAVVFDGG